MAYLLSYVRYIYNNDIYEDLLFCPPLHGRTTGMDIFQKVDDFFTEVGHFGQTVLVCALTELLQ